MSCFQERKKKGTSSSNKENRLSNRDSVSLQLAGEDSNTGNCQNQIYDTVIKI